MRTAIAAIASLIVFASLAAACGEESEMTVAEYADWCSNIGDSIDDFSNAGPYATWGELADMTQSVADASRSVENRLLNDNSLSTFHRALRGGFEMIARAA